MRRIAGVLLAVAMLGACDDPTDDDSLRVRVENRSAFTFEDLSVEFERDTLEVATLAPGATTAYQRYDGPQMLDRISVRVDGVTHTMQPAPGSIELDDDDYTLSIDVDTQGGGGIDLDVIEED